MSQVPKKVGDHLMLNKILRKNEREFFHGTFEGKVQVFVRSFIKELASAQKLEVKRDHVAHLLTDVHKNIIRYYDDQKDNEFYYIITELCLLSIEDLFPPINENEKNEKKKEDNGVLEENRIKILKSLTSKDILKQATQGLVFLHSFNFVHRNLKPSNILIAQDKQNPDKYVVKLSDFRTAKNLDDEGEQEHSGPKGSDGWIAPYLKVNGEKIKSQLSEDVFILGCLYYYVLDSQQHRHPFGKNAFTRTNNIQNKDYEVYGPNWNHGLSTDKKQPESQAIAIIKDMIQYYPENRPDIKTILDRAYFLPGDYYKLYDVPNQIPGLCVIFNQEKFYVAANNRKGSEKDKEALTDMFREFGFEVDHHDNLKANEITEKINQLVTKDYTTYGCLVVCIFSHGGDGYIHGRDGEKVLIENEKKKFKGRPSLVGKPKIWIIQACQGDELQENQENQQSTFLKQVFDFGFGTWSLFRVLVNNSIASLITNKASTPSGNAQLDPQESQKILDIPRPPMSDFLDIRATIPGFVSFRHAEGTLLIQNLCQQMRQEFLDDDKSNRHLEDILKKVQKKISAEVTWLLVNKEDKKDYEDLLKRLSPKYEQVTEEDIQKNSKIQSGFKKIYDDKTKRWIFIRPFEDTWLPVNKEDQKDYEDLLKRLSPKFEQVTEEDIQKNSKIQSGFVKIYDDKTKKWIFRRPCKQTIEWRSTLMDFIRFEDTWLLVNEEDEENYEDLLKRLHYNGIEWVQVTKEDMKNLKIDPIFHSQFRKTYNDQAKKWIFQRSCKQNRLSRGDQI